MGVRVRRATDLLAGLMFIGFGAAAVWIGRDYPLGSAMRMGPGYFPAVLGALLALLGLVVLARAFIPPAEPAPSLALKPLFLILLSIALFALSVERLGIIAAVILVVLVSATAGGRFRWAEVVALALLMAGLAVGLFTKALGLPFKLAPF